MSQNRGEFNAFDAFRRLYQKLDSLKSEMSTYEESARIVHTPFISRAFYGFLIPLFALLVDVLAILLFIGMVDLTLIGGPKSAEPIIGYTEEIGIGFTALGFGVSIFLFAVSFLMWKLFSKYQQLREGQRGLETARLKTVERIDELEELIRSLLAHKDFFPERDQSTENNTSSQTQSRNPGTSITPRR